MSKQELIAFAVGKYRDEVWCDVVPMHTGHLLLGRPWQFDCKAKYDGYKNRYSFIKDGRLITLVPLTHSQVLEDQLRMKEAREKERKEKAFEKKHHSERSVEVEDERKGAEVKEVNGKNCAGDECQVKNQNENCLSLEIVFVENLESSGQPREIAFEAELVLKESAMKAMNGNSENNEKIGAKECSVGNKSEECLVEEDERSIVQEGITMCKTDFCGRKNYEDEKSGTEIKGEENSAR